jgi:hypothetical protein
VDGRVNAGHQGTKNTKVTKGSFTGDFRPDVAVFDPLAGDWKAIGRPTVRWGTAGNVAAIGR